MKRILKRAAAILTMLVMLTVNLMLPDAYRSVTANALELPDEPVWETTVEAGGYNIRLWISESNSGNIPEYCYRGIRYYLNYELTDSATGTLVTSIPGSFSASMNIIRPDGSTAYAESFTMKNSYSISYPADAIGKWTGQIEFSGYFTGTQTYTWYVGKPVVNLRVWISDSEYGDVPTSFSYGSKYYLCYELTDLNTNQPLSSGIRGYQSTLTIYKPDGTVAHTYDYTAFPSSWIATSHYALGTWRGVVTLTGDIELELDVTWNVTKLLTDPDRFTWGQDNFNFGNNSEDFTDGHDIDEGILEGLSAAYLGDRFYADLFRFRAEKVKLLHFGGSCYGTTVAEILAKQGELDLTAFGGGSMPNDYTNTPEILSAANFFFNTQDCPETGMAVRYSNMQTYHSAYTQDRIMASIADAVLHSDDLINIIFQIVKYDADGKRTGSSGHSILAYGVEECSYTSAVTGKTYDRRLLIADPNYLERNKLYGDACLYYDSEDGSWIIPAYNYTLTDGGSKKCYWNAEDGTARNYGSLRAGLRYGVEDSVLVCTNVLEDAANVSRYYGSVEFYGTHTGSDYLSLENYTKTASAQNVNALTELFSAEDGTQSRNAWTLQGSGARILTIREPSETYGFVADHEGIAFAGDITNTSEVIFRFDGGLELNGEGIVYDVSMLGHVGDWCTVSISGSDTDSLVFTRTEEGYIVTADVLQNIGVHVTQYGYAEVSTAFSTEYTTVLLYEIDEKTIGVAADADGDGVFDTDIIGDRYTPAPELPDVLPLGDVNGDGLVDAGDAAHILVECALTGSGAPGTYTDAQMAAADADGNGVVDAGDSSFILVYAAACGSNTFKGTLEEYLEQYLAAQAA